MDEVPQRRVVELARWGMAGQGVGVAAPPVLPHRRHPRPTQPDRPAVALEAMLPASTSAN